VGQQCSDILAVPGCCLLHSGSRTISLIYTLSPMLEELSTGFHQLSTHFSLCS
jgi:hypothetical protein